jgi:hypothetical protein
MPCNSPHMDERKGEKPSTGPDPAIAMYFQKLCQWKSSLHGWNGHGRMPHTGVESIVMMETSPRPLSLGKLTDRQIPCNGVRSKKKDSCYDNSR